MFQLYFLFPNPHLLGQDLLILFFFLNTFKLLKIFKRFSAEREGADNSLFSGGAIVS